ncbi:MAG: cytochrome P450 [Deltaproteobacteria bacterium]|nr:cytochrome P450 [Deltaproteobacteria bacterium]
MRLGALPERMTEFMALLDDPRAPLVMHFHVRWQADALFSLDALRAATRRLFEKHPRLTERFALDRACWEHASDLDALVDRVWEANGASLAEFRACKIAFDRAPLFRLRADGDGLSLAMHHVLADGKSGAHFLGLLLAELTSEALPQLRVRERPEAKLTWKQLFFAIVECFTRVFDLLFRPPVMLGPVTYAGAGESFTARVVPKGELDAMNAALKSAHPGATLNEALLAAVHLSAADLLAEQKARGVVHGGSGRISVMMPLDLRQALGRAEPFHNFSTTFSVTSAPRHRRHAHALLQHVHAQVDRARRRLAGFGPFLLFSLARRLGAVAKDRAHRSRHGAPKRLTGGDPKFWRQLDTVIFTYLGKLRFPAALDQKVDGIEGYAPVLPPCGVAIDAATTQQGLCFWLHASDATLSPKDAERFCDLVVAHTRAILQPAVAVAGSPSRFATTRAFFRDPLALLGLCRDKGDFVRLNVLGPKQYVASHPALIEEILVDKGRVFRKDQALRMLARVLGEGLLTSDGTFWAQQRKLLLPAFHPSRMAGYAAQMVAASDRLASTWKPFEQKDVYKEMLALTIDIVGRTLFGAEEAEDAEEVGGALDAVIQRLSDPLYVMAPWAVHLGLPSGRRFVRALKTLDALVARLIARRRTRPLDEGDLLGLMIGAVDRGAMTKEELRNEALILYVTGHETTAIALAYTLWLVAQSPAVERRLQGELSSVLNGRLPTLDDVRALPFTECVVKEALRLYPPAWSLARQATETTKIGPHTIEKGAAIWMGPWAVQHDARFFPDPERFSPERWLDPKMEQLPKCAYFPFGSGPRVCIGQAFAKSELVLVLATIAQRFKLRFAEQAPPKMRPSFTLRPISSFAATVVPRDPEAMPAQEPVPLPQATRIMAPSKCPFRRMLGIGQVSESTDESDKTPVQTLPPAPSITEA